VIASKLGFGPSDEAGRRARETPVNSRLWHGKTDGNNTGQVGPEAGALADFILIGCRENFSKKKLANLPGEMIARSLNFFSK
jgi:hypothetical protein